MKSKVSILGTEYTIYKKAYKDEPCFEQRGIDGYCNGYAKQIVYVDTRTMECWNDESEETRSAYEKATIRHEVVHAYLHESGLDSSSFGVQHGWARNEEMVDWIALQASKIFETFQELEIL